MKLTKRAKRVTFASLAVAILPIALMADACSSDAQSKSASDLNDAALSAQQAVPYPKDKLKAGGWTERKLVNENLLREVDPNAIRYIYWLTQNGGLIASYVAKGKVVDPNSQMTPTQMVTYSSGGTPEVVEAPNDNGTYGPEPFCYFFFSPQGDENFLPCGALVTSSDTPKTFNTPPIITYDANAKSPNDKGTLGTGGGH